MPRLLRACLVLVAFTLPLLALPGCKGGAGNTTVKGNVAFPPNVKLQEGDAVTIMFTPEKGGTGLVATYQASDSSFSRNGLSPGKYKISVQVAAQGATPQRQAQLESIYNTYNIEKTPLSYDVTSDPEQSVTIDLARGNVTKK